MTCIETTFVSVFCPSSREGNMSFMCISWPARVRHGILSSGVFSAQKKDFCSCAGIIDPIQSKEICQTWLRGLLWRRMTCRRGNDSDNESYSSSSGLYGNDVSVSKSTGTNRRERDGRVGGEAIILGGVARILWRAAESLGITSSSDFIRRRGSGQRAPPLFFRWGCR